MKRSNSSHRAALAIAVAMLVPLVSCVTNSTKPGPVESPAAAAPATVPSEGAFDTTLSLPAGATVFADRGRVGLRLAGITADARCPKAVHCIQAGTVAGTIEVSVVPDARTISEFEVYEGSLAPRGELVPVAGARPCTLQVLHVEPYPLAGVPTPPGAFSALVRVIRPAR